MTAQKRSQIRSLETLSTIQWPSPLRNVPTGAVMPGAVAGALADLAELAVLGDDHLQQAEDRLVEGDVDPLAALLADVAVAQRGQCGEGGDQAGQVVGDGDRPVDGRAVRVAGDVGQAGQRRGRGAEAGLVAVRPGLAVARDADEHDVRVGGLELVVAEAPAFEGAGAEVLGDEVGARDELEEEVTAARGAHVEGDRLLVPRQRRPVERVALPEGVDGAQGVAGAGQFDLDDLGAEVPEERGAERGGDHGGEVEDAQPDERSGWDIFRHIQTVAGRRSIKRTSAPASWPGRSSW